MLGCRVSTKGCGRDRRRGYTNQKQRVRVEGQAHAVKSHAVEPALGVGEGLADVAPCEALIVGGVAVGREALADEDALRVGQELGRVGVVVYKPVCSDGNDDSSKSFLWWG